MQDLPAYKDGELDGTPTEWACSDDVIAVVINRIYVFFWNLAPVVARNKLIHSYT